MKKTAHLFIFGGLFFVLDQTIKYFSRTSWLEKKVFFRFFGWYPFQNTGAAFGIPLHIYIIIIPSLIILFLLVYLWWCNNNYLNRLGLTFIIFGATSNLLDRIFLGYTVDYFLFLTGIINLADIMIVAGFVVYLLTYKKNTRT